MSIRKLIEEDYRECVALMTNLPSEFKRALKTHERMPALFKKLESELVNVEKRLGVIDRATIKMCVYDITNMFIRMAKAQVDRKIQTKAKDVALDAMGLDIHGNGYIEELGVMIRDRQEDQSRKAE